MLAKPEIVTSPSEELRELLEGAYGKDYNTSKIEGMFSRESRYIMQRSIAGILLAAVVAEDDRIMAAAATVSDKSRGERLAAILQLSDFCRQDPSLVWCSIKEDRPVVQRAVAQGGMERVQDIATAIAILDGYRRGDAYTILDSPNGLLISNPTSNGAYLQQLWAWPEKLVAQ